MPLATTFRSPFRAPPLSLLAVEPLRAMFDGFAAHFACEAGAVGDGHPVIVYPGLGAGGAQTALLRRYLGDCGFAVHDWEGGINTGPLGRLHDWLGTLENHLGRVHEEHGRTVSLVGWSLGGLYARELAKRRPAAVRQVITLATPFASLGRGNHAGVWFQLLHPDSAHLAPDMQQRLREPPPVPTTSIYSRSDGIVSWRGCVQQRTGRCENVEVSASHLGIVSHPRALGIVAERLAQPEGQWRPLRRAAHLRGAAASRP